MASTPVDARFHAAAESNLAPISAPELGAWRGALAAWLQGHKTYPDGAHRDGIEGRVVVRFTMDSGGAVLEVALVSSSGSGVLDSAAVALLRGAHLPAPPAPAPDRISITLPIRYSLSQ